MEEIHKGFTRRSNAYSEATKRMEHKEYEWINMAFRGENRDPKKFAEIDARYKAALKEMQDARASRIR